MNNTYKGKTEDEWFENRKNPGVCQICYGCGSMATDDDNTPWFVWATMSSPSNLAVQIGMVRPIDCPICNGTGDS